MFRSALLCLIALSTLSTQELQPMQLSNMPSTSSARASWVRITNKQFEMSGKSMRVAAEGNDGLTVVILVRGIEKKRHAKPILLGKDEHALLFRSIVAERFNRIVVRNPETGEQWAARLEQGEATLED